jgi:hypothetical protein
VKLASLLLSPWHRTRFPQLPQDTCRTAPCWYGNCHHNHPELPSRGTPVPGPAWAGTSLRVRLARRLFPVRYCRPGEYALRVLGEVAASAVALAVLRWLLPLCRVPGFASWARPWQAAAVAVLAALAVLGVALLRLRWRRP